MVKYIVTMAAASPCKRLWIAALLVVVLMPDTTWGIPGEYFTTGELSNKRLPKAIAKDSTGRKVECQASCSKHPVCNAYAVSDFEGNCLMYETAPGIKPVKYTTYTLYVLRRKEEDGYYVYGTSYYKLNKERKTAIEADKVCRKDGGRLAAVKEKKLNKKLTAMMEGLTMHYAIIGVSDQKEEEKWKYSDDTEVQYTNWDWNGKWAREDLDCAILLINGKWKHYDCWHNNFFFCQIPMF